MKYYTGVGSRDTPSWALERMIASAKRYAAKGYTLRSGGADGADTAFENGCKEGSGLMDIYLPWNGFNKRYGPAYKVASTFSNYKEAEKIASEIHPAWDRCSDGAKALHTRNVYQVLGDDLNTPSVGIIYYAVVVGDSVKGGTRTAVELARKYSIPEVNLFKSA